ncbi:MAG: hypothetical protein IJ601_01230 [Acidaminococcaceae bacterium]|nr:hypothetical protein [Acidaminococcaceae bacterium]
MESVYKSIATLKWKNITVRNVHCNIYIDDNSLDFIKAELKIDEGIFQKVGDAFKIQFKAKSGNVSFFSKDTYLVHLNSKLLKTGQTEFHATLEIHDLLMFKPLNILNSNKHKSANNNTTFIFHLSDNDKMPYFKQLMTCYDGTVKVVKNDSDEFVILSNTVKCRFDTYYEFENQKRTQIVTAKKVCLIDAKLNDLCVSTIEKAIIKKVDDLLLLLSLYLRQRVTWIDFQYYIDNKVITHYRRQYKKEFIEWGTSYIPQLITGNIYNFLNVSFPVFIHSKYRNEIEKAIQSLCLNYGRKLTVEANFLSMFSVIEIIILKYRKLNNKEFIFTNRSEWDRVKKNLIRTLKQVVQENEKEILAIDKIGELRRYPLRQAYLSFCKKYNIRLEKLWEIFYQNNIDKPGLIDVRNCLIHDSSSDLSSILLYANYNLQYTIEIILLTILKWPLKYSDVNNESLCYVSQIRNLSEIKQIASRLLYKNN